MDKPVFVEETKSGILIGTIGAFDSRSFVCLSRPQAKEVQTKLIEVLDERETVQVGSKD